jgi:hypothetical protein
VPGNFVPWSDQYLGFIARAEKQETTQGAALYVKSIRYTSLKTLKSRCTNVALQGKVVDSTYFKKGVANAIDRYGFNKTA